MITLSPEKETLFTNPYQIQYVDWNSCRFYDYIIFTNGTIISWRYNRKLKIRIDENGYEFIALMINNKVYNFQFHRLVAKLFLPNPLNKPFINHIDGNRQNNALSNLEWVTGSENQLHAYEVLHRRRSVEYLCEMDSINYATLQEAMVAAGYGEKVNEGSVIHLLRSGRLKFLTDNVKNKRYLKVINELKNGINKGKRGKRDTFN